MMLNVSGLVVAYGKKQVLHGVDLSAAEGEIVGLVGHNGAGKTTILRSIVGLAPRQAGTVTFGGEPVPAGGVAANVRRGIAFVPQGRNIFSTLTVAENLAIPLSLAGEEGRARLEAVESMFPLLRERRSALASTLSGGQRQMLALGIAILRGPRLILLDEPSTGLAPFLVEEVFRRIVEMRDRFGMAVIVVDQNVSRLLGLCDRMVVLKAGAVVFDGSAEGLGADRSLWSLF